MNAEATRPMSMQQGWPRKRTGGRLWTVTLTAAMTAAAVVAAGSEAGAQQRPTIPLAPLPPTSARAALGARPAPMPPTSVRGGLSVRPAPLAPMAPVAAPWSAYAPRTPEAPVPVRAPAPAPHPIAPAGGDIRSRAPAGWLQEDPAHPLYQAAREALNERRYADAARRFEELRERHPRSGYVPDSYYWQAFALSREGGRDELVAATELLRAQAERYDEAGTRADADALLVRIEAQLAQRGDARAAAAIARQAAQPCGDERDVRLAALSALLNMNAEQAVPILREVLRSRDECSVELRRRAVFLVAQQLTDESVDILLDLAHRNPDPDPEVRQQAVFWLHEVDTPEALVALEAILTESTDPELQEQAIFAISQRSGDARASEILRSYAERTDAPQDLRENAIFWIGQSGGEEAAAYLIDLYPRLQNEELKENILHGIAQSSSAEGRTWLMERAMDPSEEIELRKNALFWAGQSGAIPAAQLGELYGGVEDPEMKEQVIFVASQSGGPEAVDFLMGVARDEQDPELRQSAIFWLGQSGDPRVAEFLLTLIRG